MTHAHTGQKEVEVGDGVMFAVLKSVARATPVRRRVFGSFAFAIISLLVASPASQAASASSKKTTDILATSRSVAEKPIVLAASDGKDSKDSKESKSESKSGEKKPGVKVKVDDGFKVQSEDKAYSYAIAGRINVDSRSYSYPTDGPFGDVENNKQLFDMRRIRLDVKATLAKYYQIKLSVDFAEGAETKEAFIQYNFFEGKEILLGQFQMPFSSEEVGSSKYFEFIEMSAICGTLCNGEDRGVMLRGDPSDGRFHYEVGVFNGAGANTPDNNNNLDTALRVVMNPEDMDADTKYWLGVSYTSGKQITAPADADPTDLRLRTESRSKKTYFKAEFDPDVPYTRTRQGLDVTVVHGPTMVKGEYMRGDYTFDQKFAFQGAYLMASYFTTGEERTVKNGIFEKQKVEEPYDPEGDGRGAIEFKIRYSLFYADSKFFENDSVYPGWDGDKLIDKGYANGGYSWDYGVNWYPDKMSRIMFDYIKSYANKDIVGSFGEVRSKSATVAETAILIRMQQEF